MKIDTSGTRHNLQKWSENIWVFDGWQEFLKKNSLLSFDQFLEMSGEVVDINRRSTVHRIHIGVPERVLYLKVHRNYLRKNCSTGFKKIAVVRIELANMMHYARIGFDHLSPVAWGERHNPDGSSDCFLLLEEIENFFPLQQWLERPEAAQRSFRTKLFCEVADGVARMHKHGIVHSDLFSWHLFLKQEGDGFVLQPIDLERSELRGRWPWSGLLLRSKQLRDLACLHLSVHWPLIGGSERLRFFLRYLGHTVVTPQDRRMILRIQRISKRLSRRKKFSPFGLAARLQGKLRG